VADGTTVRRRAADVAAVLDGCARLHFVGVGGAGMSPLAELCLARGLAVSGSDVEDGPALSRLRRLGVEAKAGHAAEHVGAATVVVRTGAVSDDNVELNVARERGLPILARADVLGWLMAARRGVGCGGTHGKTSTTAMLGAMASQLGWDPTILVGGRPMDSDSNLRRGHGDLMVVEADESDGSFLSLPCEVVVVTNVDDDHLDHYGSLDRLDEHFAAFVNGVGTGGLAVLCADDAGVARLRSRVAVPVATYGCSADADYRLSDVVVHRRSTSFSLTLPGGTVVGDLDVAGPGRHYALNAAACCAVVHHLGGAPEAMATALRAYRGVARRFEVVGCERGVTVIDDYGHHPTEVAAVLAAARQAMPEARLVVVFQPHRDSRTELLATALGRAFAAAHAVLLLPVYRPAGEPPRTRVSTALIYDELVKHHDYVVLVDQTELAAVVPVVVSQLRSGDCLLTLGAGSVTNLARMVLEYLKSGPTSGQVFMGKA